MRYFNNMKLLLTIILIIAPLFGNCQNGSGVYQVVGADLTPQIKQYQKSIDSLKTIIATKFTWQILKRVSYFDSARNQNKRGNYN